MSHTLSKVMFSFYRIPSFAAVGCHQKLHPNKLSSSLMSSMGWMCMAIKGASFDFWPLQIFDWNCAWFEFGFQTSWNSRNCQCFRFPLSALRFPSSIFLGRNSHSGTNPPCFIFFQIWFFWLLGFNLWGWWKAIFNCLFTGCPCMCSNQRNVPCMHLDTWISLHLPISIPRSEDQRIV